jgi:hypothetical protein
MTSQPANLTDLLAQWRHRAAYLAGCEEHRHQQIGSAWEQAASELEAVMPRGPIGAVPHNGTDTSQAAAASIDSTNRKGWHAQIMDLFRKADSFEGLTCGEIEARLPHGLHQSLSARVRELVKAGKLVDSGHRRKNPGTGRNARIYVPTGR